MSPQFWHVLALCYGLTSLGLMAYGLHAYFLIFAFLRWQRPWRRRQAAAIADYAHQRAPGDWPLVTVQIPVYNELAVVTRLLDSLLTLDYPRDRFEVQVLDDSTDATGAVVDQAVSRLRSSGLDIRVLRRSHRRDFKAGALAEGLRTARGELVAIFDADFVIPPDFLRRTVALLAPDSQVACVQGRWTHLNRHENWLTQAQSVGIDGHFAAEQGARAYGGLCLNFNGTGGLWRASAIAAAGGWRGDTLTEDLDLSYRAQLAGYQMRYDFDCACPAEIPNSVAALKSQQRRWAKGSIQTARLLLPAVWRSPRLSLTQKAEASLHLTHYLVAPLMVTIALLTMPMILWTPLPTVSTLLIVLWSLIVVSALAPCVMYTGSGLVLGQTGFALSRFPAMLALGTGLCLNNSLAVLQGLVGGRGEFVRTPKSGSRDGRPQASAYRVRSHPGLALAELVFALYCLVTFVVYLETGKYLFGFFIAAYAVGLGTFGLSGLRQSWWPAPAASLVAPATPETLP